MTQEKIENTAEIIRVFEEAKNKFGGMAYIIYDNENDIWARSIYKKTETVFTIPEKGMVNLNDYTLLLKENDSVITDINDDDDNSLWIEVFDRRTGFKTKVLFIANKNREQSSLVKAMLR